MPGTRSTAASLPGPATVPWPTKRSYCSHTQRLEAQVGSPARASTASAGSASSGTSAPGPAGGGEGATIGRWYTGPSSARLAAGTSATTSPRNRTFTIPPAVISPSTLARIPQRRQTSSTSSSRAGSTRASMRSWDSETSTSQASIDGSRRGTASRSTSMPIPALAATSATAQLIPAAPRSWSPRSSLRSPSSRQASISSFSWNGSPTCTLGRLASSPSSKLAEASTLAPPIPSRPVLAPISTARSPGCSARPLSSRSTGMNPMVRALTSGLPA